MFIYKFVCLLSFTIKDYLQSLTLLKIYKYFLGKLMVILYIFILILDILKFLNKSKSKFCWLTGFYVVLIQIEC